MNDLLCFFPFRYISLIYTFSLPQFSVVVSSFLPLLSVMVSPSMQGGLHCDFFVLCCSERNACHEVLTVSFFAASESEVVIDYGLLVFYYQEVVYLFREGCGKVYMPFRAPSSHQLVSGNGRVVFQSQIRPIAMVPQGVVHVDHHKRFVRFGISKSEHTTSYSCRHFGLYLIVEQVYRMIVWGSYFSVVRVS